MPIHQIIESSDIHELEKEINALSARGYEVVGFSATETEITDRTYVCILKSNAHSVSLCER